MSPGLLRDKRLAIRALRTLQKKIAHMRLALRGGDDAKALSLARELAGMEKVIRVLGRESKQLNFREAA